MDDYVDKGDVDNFSSNSDDLGFDGGFGGGYGETPLDKHSDLLKGLSNFDPYLKTLISEWLGLRWDEEKEKYVKDSDVRPVMNIHGARWCINALRTYARGNNIITTVGREEYNDIISDIIDYIYLNVGSRSEEFGINNDGDIMLVANQIIHSSQLILMGAGGSNNYNALLSTTVNRNENVSMSGMQDGFGKPIRRAGVGGFAKNMWKTLTGG